MTVPASAIVVAGGQSRRFGEDKRRVRLPSGRTLLAEVVDRLAGLVDEVVVVVAKDPEAFPDLPATVVQDRWPGSGPLNAIATGLATIQTDRAIVVAADLPLLSRPLLRAMRDQPVDYDLLVPRRADGRLEMLHAIYRLTCRSAMHRRLAAGQLRLTDLVADVRVRFLDEPELRQYDPDLRSFTNVNTPADLQRLVSCSDEFDFPLSNR